MTSHIPFLTVRPNEQFSSSSETVKTRDFASSINGIPHASASNVFEHTSAMDETRIGLPAASRLPAFVRFPLACLISLSLSTLLYSISADFAGYELAAVSRDLTAEWQVGTALGWKLVALCFAWYAGYDCMYHAGPRWVHKRAKADTL